MDLLYVYGCVGDWTDPTDINSNIPLGYDVVMLGLYALPDPEGDECVVDNDYSLEGDWGSEDFGGGDVCYRLCSCPGGACNGDLPFLACR